MIIVQLADLHLAIPQANLTEEQCFASITEAVESIASAGEEVLVAICGDLVSKGQIDQGHFVEAFLDTLRERLQRDCRFGVVPGNHDIDTTRSTSGQFEHVDHVTQCLGEYTRYSGAEGVFVYSFGGVDIVTMNTAYHGDHTYGKAPLDSLEGALQGRPASPRVLIMHHHVLRSTTNRNDCSALENGYELLMKAEPFQISLVLHGHQHAASAVRATRHAIPVIGSGSLFTLGELPNVNSQFNVLQFRDGEVAQAVTYRLIGDADARADRQAFVPRELHIW